MASRFVRANPAIHLLLVGASLLALAGCQTNQLVETMEVGDAAPETPAAVPKKNNGPLPASAAAYTDPLVVSAANDRKVPTATRKNAPVTPDPVQQVAAPADLGELTMQPTTVSAGRNSIFSAPTQAATQESEDLTTASETVSPTVNTSASSSIVPADLPARAVSPINKSLFSADLPQPVEPTREAAVMPDYSEPAAPTKYDAAEPISLAEEEAQKSTASVPAAAAEPEVASADAPQKKRKWLPSLSEILSGGKKNKGDQNASAESH
ncbi:hypothetical protein ACWKW9_09000 [Rhizobium daejeonense]